GLNFGINYGEFNIRNAAGVPSRAVVGADWNGSLFGLLNLKGEIISSNRVSLTPPPPPNNNNPDTLFYTVAGVNLGPISVRGNYRSI
ncbi:hypothetical protein ABTN37_18770, partial [Acinetobacter baumannii]